MVAGKAGIPSLLFDCRSQGMTGWVDGGLDEHNKTGWIGKNKLEEITYVGNARKDTGVYYRLYRLGDRK